MLCVMLANTSTGSGGNIYGSGGGRLAPDREKLGMTRVEEHVDLMIDGEYGTGGRPLVKIPPNPYLEIDLIDPTDPILFQGELQKYKPGFNGVFIDRWVQVTRKAIRYFANKPGSALAAGKPLMAFPIIAIKSIEKLEADL